MKQVYHQTPLFYSHRLKASTGANVWLKMDCFQPSGSFKLRGMSRMVAHYQAQGQRHFITASGGNAGLSLAYAANLMDATVEVIVPITTSLFMIEKIKSLGATVAVVGNEWTFANDHALQRCAETGAQYVPAFDHPLLWQGHASLMDECANEIPPPDTIVVAVGGGGLLAGVMEGMRQHQWNNTQIIAAETIGAASFAASYQAGKLVTLNGIDTIATSLGARTIAQQCLEKAQQFKVSCHVVDDATALAACVQLLDEFQVLVEPACGAALSYVYEPGNIKPNQQILVVVCGGAGMSMAQYNTWCNNLL